MFFSASMISLAYLILHIFDNPETSIKYTGLMFMLVAILIPAILSSIIAAFFAFESSWKESLYFWFFVDPILTFGATTFNFCVKQFDESF